MAKGDYIHFFDLSFEEGNQAKWAKQYWKLAFVASTVYLVLIFTGKRYMASRQPFRLHGLLKLWSLFVAAFSIVVAYHVFEEVANVWNNWGFHGLICHTGILYSDPSVGFWIYLLTVSKLWELGDTFFIVLRKQQLPFVLCYHHVTALLLGSFLYQNESPLGRMFGLANSIAHILLYSYLTLKAMKVNFPRFVPVVISIVELVQLSFGLFFSYYAYDALIREEKCAVDFWDVKVSSFVYFSDLVLFVNYFYQSFVKEENKMSEKIN